MKILAIESSCDETACSIVLDGKKIIASTISSSLELHKKTGGVIPEQAAREQIKFMIPVLKECLKIAFPEKIFTKAMEEIDAIAMTIGPGLIGSLLVGVETAKTLAYLYNKPLVPVNHLVAHLYANWLENDKTKYIENDSKVFPAVCLVISGGHTDLVLMKKHGDLTYLGGTRDDAAGEAFDKTARLLGLSGYFGGPAIAKAAQNFRIKNIKPAYRFPRPMIESDNLDFSFSGLKTAVINYVKNQSKLNVEKIEEISFEIEESISDVTAKKIERAIFQYQPKSILIAGGVSANLLLREKIAKVCEKNNIPFFVPPISLCNDNATYIASCAFFNFHPVEIFSANANPNLHIV